MFRDRSGKRTNIGMRVGKVGFHTLPRLHILALDLGCRRCAVNHLLHLRPIDPIDRKAAEEEVIAASGGGRCLPVTCRNQPLVPHGLLHGRTVRHALAHGNQRRGNGDVEELGP